MTEPTRVAFVCVQNAGRSQMAYAFAREARAKRGLKEAIDLRTGGTRPTDQVHPEVIEAMANIGLDVSHRSPRELSFEDLQECDYVITMGCAAEDVCPAGWAGESRDWDLEDPDGKSPETVAAIRDEIAERVEGLFDELAINRQPSPEDW